MAFSRHISAFRGQASSQDRSVVRAARRGSRGAVEAIVRGHWDGAYRIGFLITGDAASAEDIAQESILAALDRLDSFDDSRPFEPWLQRIAVNNAIDWLRRRQRRPEVIVDDVAELEDEAAFSDRIPGSALDDDIVSALRRLQPEFRAVVVLRYLLDLEPREIATLVDAPAATVRTRLYRGLRQLQRELSNDVGGIDEQVG